jgi:hypothetical protein
MHGDRIEIAVTAAMNNVSKGHHRFGMGIEHKETDRDSNAQPSAVNSLRTKVELLAAVLSGNIRPRTDEQSAHILISMAVHAKSRQQEIGENRPPQSLTRIPPSLPIPRDPSCQ